MLMARHVAVGVVVWLALLPASALGVHLRGSVVHIGYPGSGSAQTEKGAHYYRVGSWVPVLVELTNDDGDRFEGRIEVRQPDRDGDEVVARRDVVVQGTRQFFLYVPGGRFERPEQFCIWVFEAGGQFAELHDDAGQRVTELRPPPTILPAPSETRLILDVSPRPINQLAGLAMDEKLVRGIIVMRGSPREIPDEAAGLEMIDTVVWDGADPKEIDLPQRNALMHWVRMGGTLILGVGRNWDRVIEGKFGEMLPARPHGTALMPEMPEWLGAMLGVDAFDSTTGKLSPPLTYCPLTRRDLASNATAVIPSREDDSTAGAAGGAAGHLLVTRRPVERGEVILVAAELLDLLKHGRRNPAMLRDLLSIRVITEHGKKEQQGGGGMMSGETDAFTPVEQQTGFGVMGGLYVLIAFVFVVAYVAVATVGGWFWLKRKGALQHAWNLFAATALAGSFLSVMAVQWIRGFTYQVQELSVVDARAGQNTATMTSFLGLKSPTHSRLDLRMPADWTAPDEVTGDGSCMLRPLPSLSDNEGHYSAVEQYEAVASLGELRAVPLRATLKQFEANWQGKLTGRLNASLRYTRAGSTELDSGSWIQNDLGTDLYDCCLLVTSQSVRSDRAHRDLSIEVYNVGKLPRGKRITVQDLQDRADAIAKANAKSDADAAIIRSKVFKPPLSEVVSGRWLPGIVPRLQIQALAASTLPVPQVEDKFVKALLLLTVYNEIDVKGALTEGNELRRSHGLDLDRSDFLLPAESLLVGFSSDPGPARLCYRKAERAGGQWNPIAPTQANVMYRVMIPVKQP